MDIQNVTRSVDSILPQVVRNLNMERYANALPNEMAVVRDYLIHGMFYTGIAQNMTPDTVGNYACAIVSAFFHRILHPQGVNFQTTQAAMNALQDLEHAIAAGVQADQPFHNSGSYGLPQDNSGGFYNSQHVDVRAGGRGQQVGVNNGNFYDNFHDVQNNNRHAKQTWQQSNNNSNVVNQNAAPTAYRKAPVETGEFDMSDFTTTQEKETEMKEADHKPYFGSFNKGKPADPVVEEIKQEMAVEAEEQPAFSIELEGSLVGDEYIVDGITARPCFNNIVNFIPHTSEVKTTDGEVHELPPFDGYMFRYVTSNLCSPYVKLKDNQDNAVTDLSQTIDDINRAISECICSDDIDVKTIDGLITDLNHIQTESGVNVQSVFDRIITRHMNMAIKATMGSDTTISLPSFFTTYSEIMKIIQDQYGPAARSAFYQRFLMLMETLTVSLLCEDDSAKIGHINIGQTVPVLYVDEVTHYSSTRCEIISSNDKFKSLMQEMLHKALEIVDFFYLSDNAGNIYMVNWQGFGNPSISKTIEFQL